MAIPRLMLVCAISGVLAATAATAEDLPKITCGEPARLKVVLSTGSHAAATVRYTVEPSSGVVIVGNKAGDVVWNPAKGPDLRLPLQIVVTGAPVTVGAPFLAARVHVRWPDGSETTKDVTVVVTAAPGSAAAIGKDMEAEVIPAPNATSPGTVVRLMYTVFNYEETPQRVRLRVDAGAGARVLDPSLEGREWIIEPSDEIDGEIHVMVPEGAKVGQRQIVRLIVELVSDSRSFEAQNHVSIVRSGGAKPGVKAVSGTSALGLSRLGPNGFKGAQRAAGLTLSSTLGKTNVSFDYDRGLKQNLSNFRYDQEPTRLSGSVLHPGWNLSFGNGVSSAGQALTGPYVRGRGASLRRTDGRFIGELVVAQPSVLLGTAAGHLVRGSLGVKTKWATLGLVASDFSRPAGGYSTVVVQQTVLSADALEQLEIQRRLSAASASNRVQGFGLDVELRPSSTQRIALRAGSMRLSSATGARLDAPVAEAAYSLSTTQATFNARWRKMPPTLQGIYIAGDESSADGSLRVVGDVRLTGRVYQNESETLGSTFRAAGNGTSAGLRFVRGARRLELQGNYRESEFSVKTVRRTASLLFGTPLGPLSLSGNAEVGEQESGGRVSPTQFYRGDLRWMGKAGTASFGLSQLSAGTAAAQQRADLMASLKVGGFELAGGAWATRGYAAGGRPGMWTSLDIPITYDVALSVGVDHSPLVWTAEPTWRTTVSVRKRFVLPLPFLHAAPIPGLAPPVSASPSTQ
jgi:hypothetical protein